MWVCRLTEKYVQNPWTKTQLLKYLNLPITDMEWIKQQTQSVANTREDKMYVLCLLYDATNIGDGGDFLLQVIFWKTD